METESENDWYEETTTGIESDNNSSTYGDDEVLLYSLVHHKPASDEDEAVSHLNASSDVNGSYFSISRRSKVSRYDRVKGIMAESAERNAAVTSSQSNVDIIRNSEGFVNNTLNYIDIRPYQSTDHTGRSNFSKNVTDCDGRVHSCEPQIECDSSENANLNNKGSDSSQSLSHVNKGAVGKSNLRAVLEALAGYVQNESSKRSKKKERKVTSKNKKSPKKSTSLQTTLLAKENNSNTQIIITNSSEKANSKTQCINNESSLKSNAVTNDIENQVSPTEQSTSTLRCTSKDATKNAEEVNTLPSGIETGVAPSKYNLELNKKQKRKSTTRNIKNGDQSAIESPTKQSSDQDVIELFTDSDVDSDKSSDIVVVDPPPKPSPPLVVLDSSDESENVARVAQSSIIEVERPCEKATTSVRQLNNLIVHCSMSEQNNQNNTPDSTNTDLNRSVIYVSDSERNTGKRKKQKKGNTKKKRTQVSAAAVVEEPSSTSTMSLTSDCYSWTPEMVRFYNQSWGGQDFEIDKIQRNMSGHPRHWKILDADRYGPLKRSGPNARIRCHNCNQLGHMSHRCPDPPKKITCYMCGETGHREPRCPNKICLKCGRPSALYTVGCSYCSAPGSEPYICNTCGQMGHYMHQCPTAWRGFHMVTSQDDITHFTNKTKYKPHSQQYCGICAKKGHRTEACLRQSSQIPFASMTIPGSSGMQMLPPVYNHVDPNGKMPGPMLKDNGFHLQQWKRRQRKERKREKKRERREMLVAHGIVRGKKRRNLQSYANFYPVS